MTPSRAFWLSVLIGSFGSILIAVSQVPPTQERSAAQLMAASRVPASQVPRTAMGHLLQTGVFVREQLALDGLERLRAEGFRTIVDLRPDGEEAGQPTSAVVGGASRLAGLAFAYIPTPHGDIPDDVIDRFAAVLATAERPVMLYCRSGKRAARVWALAEASRANGLGIEAITAAVRAAGQPIGDLKARIEARVAARDLSK